jgi:hypothetical protein
MRAELRVTRCEEAGRGTIQVEPVPIAGARPICLDTQARLAVQLKPSRSSTRVLWNEAASVLELERSALSPLAEVVESKFRVRIQPAVEMPSRGLAEAVSTTLCLAAPMDPCAMDPDIDLSGFGTTCSQELVLSSASLYSSPAAPLQPAGTLRQVEVTQQLFPAFRRLPSPLQDTLG